MATILHIEDDPRNRLLVRKLLSSEGHVVLEAESGLEAIQVARQSALDLVLVDINIPNLDGYEVTLRLRSIPALQRTPIVVITAEGERQTSLAVGADGFLTKPIDAAKFGRIIQRFLGGHREPSENTTPDRLRERSQIIVQRLEEKLQELQEANTRLEELGRLRSEFLRNMSHELATPLTPVVGYLRLLLQGDLGALSASQTKALRAVESSMQRLRNVVDTLVDVSALETGAIQLVSQSYDFNALAQKSVELCHARYDTSRVQFVCRFLERPCLAVGDPEKLLRAMLHMLENALKFATSGSHIAVESTAMEVGGADPMRFAVSNMPVAMRVHRYGFSVADSGPGIAPSHQQKIFEPFYQVDGSRTRAFGGVGLGLAFAQRIARAHGGDVTVESPPRTVIGGAKLDGTLVRLTVSERPVAEHPVAEHPVAELPIAERRSH